LQEGGIHPDIIAGTSVGALVGGAFLAGHLDDLETWARALNKRRMVSYLDLALGGSGLIGGQRLGDTMASYLGDVSIEELPARFAAVCSELSTGHELWVQTGSLTDAIQASYALPGVFPPRFLHGRWLIDGALVNPVPVSVCRALGARLVIAISLHADAFGRAAVERKERFDEAASSASEEHSDKRGTWRARMMRQLFGSQGAPTPGVGNVLLASLNIVMDRLSRSRLAGDPPDVLIMPQVGHVSLLDFDRAEEAIALGYQAVEREWPRIHQALEVLA
jgi:NTE family protein